MDIFQNALLVPLSPIHSQLLLENLLSVFLSKGECVLRPGQRGDGIYFVRYGLLRHYLLQDGKEVNTHFALPGTFTADFASLAHQQPTTLHMEAMEETSLWLLRRADMLALYERAAELQAVGRGLMEQLLAQQQIRLELLLCTSATQRYCSLQQRQPELLQTISLRHLASYLGLSRETLSRIRALEG